MDCKTPHRLQLALFIFNVLVKQHIRENEGPGCRAKCLMLLWRSIPDAFITPDELQNIIVPFIKPQFVVDVLKDIAIKYEICSMFDEPNKEICPRSLTHMCRVNIRKVLSSKYNLQNGIPQLNIPIELKSLLSLKF